MWCLTLSLAWHIHVKRFGTVSQEWPCGETLWVTLTDFNGTVTDLSMFWDFVYKKSVFCFFFSSNENIIIYSVYLRYISILCATLLCFPHFCFWLLCFCPLSSSASDSRHHYRWSVCPVPLQLIRLQVVWLRWDRSVPLSAGRERAQMWPMLTGILQLSRGRLHT